METPKNFHLRALLSFLQNILNPHLTSHKRSLTQIHLLNQDTPLLKSHQRRFPQIHILNQVTIPADISHHYHLSKHQKIILKLYPQIQDYSGLTSPLTLENTSVQPLLVPTSAQSVSPSPIPSADPPSLLIYNDPCILTIN